MAPLATLGLWGDGDEVWAIEEAFRNIGVAVPVEDASNWVRVGDLWTSATRIAPDLLNDRKAWARFRQGLAQETGVPWEEVDETTVLIDGRGHNIISRLIFSLREKWQQRHA